MRSADKIKRIFKNADLSINPDTNEKVFKDVIRARQEIMESMPAMPKSIWRTITKSPLVKLAVAVIITIVSVTGLFFWKSTGSGIALADVLTGIEQAKTYMYEMSMTVTGQYFDGNPIHLEAHISALVSREYGVRIKCETSPLPITGQRINQDIYILIPKRTVTTLMPNEKTYSQTEFDETSLEKIRKEYNDPRFIVRRILKCEHKSLGKSIIEGVKVERFQTSDPNFAEGTFGQTDTKIDIWIDARTHLPIRIEMNVNKENMMQIYGLIYDFQWDVSVDAAEFEAVIPDDYTIGQPLMRIAPQKESSRIIPNP